MKQKSFPRFLVFFPDNPKSKIQNPKWVIVVVLAVAFVLYGAAADAQQTGKIPRIGYLEPGTASGNTVLLDGFRQELSKLGWFEGKNITVEYRFGEQKHERLSQLH